MNNKVKRYAIIMVIGIIMNVGFYYIAHVFHLPAWIDNVGTAYAAVALEPAAGLLVAFATNFYQAAVVYDSSSLVYYAVSAIVALIFGIGLRKSGQICWSRMVRVVIIYIFVGTLLAGLLTIWRTSGLPDSGWERHFYKMALGWGMPKVLACFFGTAILKVVDAFILAVLVPIFCKVTPQSMITKVLHEPVAWSNPYWNKKNG